ncbi:MAG: glycosyltransferase family 39 protein [Planctomycetota bacterium]
MTLVTHRDYGATWDEGLQARYGELALRYFASGGTDTACNTFEDLRFYNPLVEMVPALFYDAQDPERFRIRHLYLGLLASLCIPLVWGFARRLGDPLAALCGVLSLATLPRFYGHWHNNSKDLPFAVAFAGFLWAATRWLGHDRLPWQRALVGGLAGGAVLAVRPGGLPLLVAFAGLAAVVGRLSADRRETAMPLGTAGRRLAAQIPVALAIAWVLMVLPWPWAHEQPLRHPLQAMQVATDFTTTVPVLFDGATIASDKLPRSYMARYVLIGTPLTVLVLAALGVLRGLATQRPPWRGASGGAFVMTTAWLLVPLLLFAVLRPNVYGGMRHFLFVLPALAILAGYGASWLPRVAAGRLSRGALTAAALALVALPATTAVRLHPYQMTYYNALVGGVAGASRDYWTDYWLASYREAIHWVNARAAEHPERLTIAVLGIGDPGMLWAQTYAAENVQLVRLAEARQQRPSLAPADYYIGSTRNGLDRHYPDAAVAHSIGRDGAVFTVIRQAPTANEGDAPNGDGR